MQPYFFPYIGYFQLIGAVDLFIIYDNIKYTKKGWINRNRLLQDGKDAVFSLPLKKDSDFLDVRDRWIAPDFDKAKLLAQFNGAYRRAPHFNAIFPIVEKAVTANETNLFRYLHNSLVHTCDYLGIDTKQAISSDIDIDHSLKGQDKVLALCHAVGATEYINAIGGQALYTKQAFSERGINLKFLQTKSVEYKQFEGVFVPSLSIIDIMMFNSKERIEHFLRFDYDLK